MQTFSYGSQDSEFDYQVDYSRSQGEQSAQGDKAKGRNRRPSYARVSVAPAARSGIHRRRNKRWSW
jgi:hypothetical protein